MKLPQQLININYLVAVPLIVMSYHIFNFYESEPALVRVGLALSFDLMVVLCFYQLKNPAIANHKLAKQATWCTLLVLIAFQMYVNIWAYWELHWFRAIVSGMILPVTVAMVTFVSMLRDQQTELAQEKEHQKQQAREKIKQIYMEESGLQELASERPFKDVKVTKPEVIDAFNTDPENGRDLFLGCANMRSVRRWWKKLEAGETP